MRSDLENGTAVSSTARASSSSEALENVLDTTAGPCFASNEASCFKENMGTNKFETPKLAMEPLQMKKKKRGCGFNLRKSLAWDRAFFTEEGVLDPQELSVFSGASCREGLSFINEQIAVGSQLPSKPTDMQKLKNNVLRKHQSEDLRKKDASSLRLDSAPNFIASPSLASHKISTIIGCKKSGSSCSDIPRPLASSSLKRPANLNFGRAAGKELKLLKVPGSKPGFSPISAKTKKTISKANNVKHNQITQPGLKSSCESLKKTQNASRYLQSVLYSDRNSDNSSYRRHSSINTSPVLLGKADNSGSNTITAARPVPAPEGQHELATSAALLARNAHFSGGAMHTSQNQVLKPSGLRMPSPSLSFFSQPKPSVFCDVSLTGTAIGVCGFQRQENSRLNENWRTPEVDDKIQRITIHSKATSSRSVCPSSHVCAVASITPIMEQAPMQKVQDCSEENRIQKMPHNEAELQRIKDEVPSLSHDQEQVMNDNIYKGGSDCYPEKSELCKRGWKNPKLQSEWRLAIQESVATLAVDELSEEKDTQCEDTLNHREQKSLINQSDGEDVSKSDCHGPCSSKTDSVKNCLYETDKDKNSPKSRESEQLDVSQKNGGWCGQSGSLEALKSRTSKSENSYLRSKDLCADLSKESSVVGLSIDHLLAGCSQILSAACNPNIEECKNNVSLILDVSDDSKKIGKRSVLKSSSEVGLELQTNVELNTSERLPEKQICLEEQNIEKLTFVCPDTKDGSRVISTQMGNSSSLGKGLDCNLDQDKSVGETPSTDSNSVGNSMSSLRHNNVIKNSFDSDRKHEGDTNYMFNDPGYDNLSNSLNVGSPRTEFDYFSLSTVSGTHEVSEENTLGNTGEAGSSIQDGSTNDQLSLYAPLKENEQDMDNLRNAKDWGTELLQPPESSMLNKYCSKQPEQLTSHAKFGAENREHDNVALHCENYLQREIPANKHDKDNELWSKKNSITEQSNMHASNFKSPNIRAQEKPLEHGSCNDEYGTCVASFIADPVTAPQRICPLSDTANSGASGDNNSFSGCIHPKFDAVKVETHLAPANMCGDVQSEKSRMLVLPQNAIPFSDEWLAAIEAAGEDILTRKTGAVQNSPPDKSVPEPSPWSPVKKRNNQIGPFDCTKCTNNLPPDSN